MDQWSIKTLFLVAFCVLFFSFAVVKCDKYDESIFFNYYNASGELTHVYNLVENNAYPYDDECNPKEKFAILAFGWRIECGQDVAKDIIINLKKHRGGCVICVDYSKFSVLKIYPTNPRLRRQFKNITSVMTQKLQRLESEGFDPDNGFMYGYSLGGQIVLDAAKEFGVQKINSIDVCDAVGLGFDVDERLEPSPNHRIAAKNVQCIHTSKGYGTKHIDSCHQDWIMGHCGGDQDAATLANSGSHGSCNLFYNSSFDYEFLAVQNPENCSVKNPVKSWPNGFKMGYLETRKIVVPRGQLFALTYSTYPYSTNDTLIIAAAAAITTTETTVNTTAPSGDELTLEAEEQDEPVQVDDQEDYSSNVAS